MDQSGNETDVHKSYFSVKASLSALSFSSNPNHPNPPSPPPLPRTATDLAHDDYVPRIHPTAADAAAADEEEDEPVGCREAIMWNYEKHSLLIEVSLAILFAYIYPTLGAKYLFPDITAHWIAVILIFFLSGFALRIEALSTAAANYKFNIFVMVFNFFGVSAVVNFVATFFYNGEVISEDLMKGMIICSCLSMPTNMMIVLTVSSKGDEAVALFLATVMNLLGVFVTPLLIFFYLKEDSDIDFVSTYRTISLRVLLPVSVGLTMKNTLNGAHEFADEHKAIFLTIREKALVYIVYATFCSTFNAESDSTGAQIVVMAISQVILLASTMIIAWIFLFIFFNRQPQLRVCGLFGCSTKTAALGIPLISAIYEDHPKLGIYSLPLLIWYPTQLIIGTVLSSRLSRFVDYKVAKHEAERIRNEYQPKGCGLLQKPSWIGDDCS